MTSATFNTFALFVNSNHMKNLPTSDINQTGTTSTTYDPLIE